MYIFIFKVLETEVRYRRRINFKSYLEPLKKKIGRDLDHACISFVYGRKPPSDILKSRSPFRDGVPAGIERSMDLLSVTINH